MTSEDVAIECGPMGPIGEHEALILRVNRHCPWNRCLFCPVYKGRKFGLRNLDEIKRDIDAVALLRDRLEAVSWEMGTSGRINGETIHELLRRYPAVFGNYPREMTFAQAKAVDTLGAVANWLLHGAKRVFLQDADALTMKSSELAETIRYLKGAFPSITIVSSYARSKTCQRKDPEELSELQESGLSWCYVGIESGCDDILSYMKKGVTGREHIEGGRAVMESGISMAAFVMPGLAGGNVASSRRHIEDTLSVLNEIRPSEVRVRSLAINEQSLLYDRWRAGEFTEPTDDLMIDEIRMLIEGLAFECTFETLQMTNPLFTVRGPFSKLRGGMCRAIEEYQGLPASERARFMLDRYTEGGYLSFVRRWGRYDEGLRTMIEDARKSLESEDPKSVEKVNKAVFAIKSKGVP